MINKVISKNIHIPNINVQMLSSIIDETISKMFKIRLNFFYEVIFLSPKQMLNLNQKTRKRNYVADVITISFYENKINNKIIESKILTPILGEIYLCPNKIKNNAKKYNVTFLSEFSRMFIHGILHLLDFDHEKSVAVEYLTLEIQDKINKKVLKKYKQHEKN
ncbi:rRNA maturation RNase YbeY [Mycoplasmoides pirum]|uniref:rRNA maturation RNase YbeY n=1 Tax=Mycoplasmoides pirum TaxID=2122 RepID=UPI000482A543|nr:rRNA maturation RNase YbeY [Mycoplasmoides pirum]